MEVKIHAKKASVIIGQCLLLVMILAVIALGAYSAAEYNNDFSQPKAYIGVIILALLFVVFFYQLWQLISYKIIISDKEIMLSANKAFFRTLNAEMHIKYEGLKSVKHLNGAASNYGKNLSGKINILQFEYENGAIVEARVNRFSDKQTESIMALIKEVGKKYYSIDVEI